MRLIWVRKLCFHILAKSSTSPRAEFWLFQSAPCRRVCLLIPLFRKRKKKGLKKTPFGSSTEWEQNVSVAGKKTISWPALLRPPAALRPWDQGRCGSSSVPVSPVGGQSHREGQEGHTATDRASLQPSALFKKGKQQKTTKIKAGGGLSVTSNKV